MTRLTTNEVKYIKNTIAVHSNTLKEKTGIGLHELAAMTSQIPAIEFSESIKKISVSAITITSGMGEIGHFAESISAIARQIGAKVDMATGTDVFAIANACEEGTDVLYMADDNKFIALNLKTRNIGDNNLATALGYVLLLEGFAKKRYGEELKGREVLVIGYGRIGKMAIKALEDIDAIPVVYDIKHSEITSAKKNGYKVIESKNEIKGYKYILDGTNSGGWMGHEIIKEDALIAAFGVPTSIKIESERILEDRIISDTLAIGVAAMLGLSLKEAK